MPVQWGRLYADVGQSDDTLAVAIYSCCPNLRVVARKILLVFEFLFCSERTVTYTFSSAEVHQGFPDIMTTEIP